MALQLGANGNAAAAGVLTVVATGFGALVIGGLRRVRRLDDYEKGLRS